jgi:hypothetical protein
MTKANDAAWRKQKVLAGLEAQHLRHHNAGMSWYRVLIFAGALLAFAGAQISAQEKTTAKPSTPVTPSAAAVKLETFVMLPEPKVMRTDRSRLLPDAKTTVISPAHEIAESPGVRIYSADEFAKLGISAETFLERARTAADRRLATLTPDYIKDDEGRLRYAVYRGDSPLIASLLIAPSLGTFFQKTFGGDVWALLPDRNSLYLFPARPDALAEFTVDLRDRYDSNPYAASAEIFLLKPDGALPRVVGTFGN